MTANEVIVAALEQNRTDNTVANAATAEIALAAARMVIVPRDVVEAKDKAIDAFLSRIHNESRADTDYVISLMEAAKLEQTK
jgi:hypothetical protein